MFVARIPSPALRPYVSLVWFASGATSSARREWVLPSGTSQLLVNLSEDRLTFHRSLVHASSLPGLALSGPFSKRLLVESQEQDLLCGASIRAGATSAFVDVPASALHNEMVALYELASGKHSRDLLSPGERIAHPGHALDSLEHMLRSLLRPTELPSFLAWMLRELEDPERRIRDLVNESGISKRRLVNRFREFVGVTPKRYQRIRRFRKALWEMRSTSSIVDVAHKCGFYDQSHMDHEFSALAGMAPSAYVDRQTGYVGHAALEE